MMMSPRENRERPAGSESAVLVREPDSEVSTNDVWRWLAAVPDPEIPVLNVLDLGLIRDVSIGRDRVEVSVAPTYIGCPATEYIEQSIIAELNKQGIRDVRIKRVLSPAWTSDWISEAGRSKLIAYGIAPPSGEVSKKQVLSGNRPLACPRCDATDTLRVSEFGSTPCKASYKCSACLEPFEYFKCI